MAELPTGTVTFLFTDLEVSTRLWEQEPDAMRDALARHDAMLREAVGAYGGQIVKGTGDGALAVFATADAAVKAAIEAQLRIGAEPWTVSEPLRVRMGVHTGVAVGLVKTSAAGVLLRHRDYPRPGDPSFFTCRRT